MERLDRPSAAREAARRFSASRVSMTWPEEARKRRRRETFADRFDAVCADDDASIVVIAAAAVITAVLLLPGK